MRSESPREWYFMCHACDCKFFCDEQQSPCPRCGEELTSREQLMLPWRMYTIAEASDLVGLSTSKLYELVQEKKIGHHRMDGSIRISGAQIEMYLATTNVETMREREESPTKEKHSRPRLRHIRLS